MADNFLEDSQDVSIPHLEDALKRSTGASSLEPVLKAIVSLQRPIEVDNNLYGKKLYFKNIDRLVPSVCKNLGMPDVSHSSSHPARIVVLATEVYSVGGHTRIIEDIQRLADTATCTLVLSDPRGMFNHFGELAKGLGFLKDKFDPIIICKDPSALGRIYELFSILHAINPEKIFLVNHHADIISVVACWPFRDIVNFVHHTDYLPCFGASISEFKHCDVTYACHSFCREHVANAQYIGMSLPRFDPYSHNAVLSQERLIIATSGTQRKFSGKRLYEWTDWVVSILAVRNACIKHIGPVTVEFRDAMIAFLKSADIDTHRYEFVGQVTSVFTTLKQCGAKLYISSYPEAGFRGNLEALACGLPVVVLEDEMTPELLRFRFPVSGWFTIHSPSEFSGMLEHVTATFEPQTTAIENELVRFEKSIKENTI